MILAQVFCFYVLPHIVMAGGMSAYGVLQFVDLDTLASLCTRRGAVGTQTAKRGLKFPLVLNVNLLRFDMGRLQVRAEESNCKMK